MHKNDRGMSFRKLSALYYVILGKQAWKFVTNLGNMITRVFKAKYFLDVYGIGRIYSDLEAQLIV